MHTLDRACAVLETQGMPSVLIIEDDPGMLRALTDNFEMAGYEVHVARDGEAGLKQALSVRADLIILDLMLPHINGYEICKFLRDEKSDAAILMLTAKSDEEDVIRGLKLGADDYMTKPFSVRELMARAEVLLRRSTRAKMEIFHLRARVLRRGDQEVKLSPKEFDLLQFFVENAGKALSRDEIMNAVWGWESAVTPRSIDRFVTTLRTKLETDGEGYIKTVREFGYKFVTPELGEDPE
jgi:DNA-binding response OmpR family regulator